MCQIFKVPLRSFTFERMCGPKYPRFFVVCLARYPRTIATAPYATSTLQHSHALSTPTVSCLTASYPNYHSVGESRARVRTQGIGVQRCRHPRLPWTREPLVLPPVCVPSLSGHRGARPPPPPPPMPLGRGRYGSRRVRVGWMGRSCAKAVPGVPRGR